MTNEVKEVNIDLIKELRAQGKNLEANNLIRSYQENKRENLEQLKKEMKNQDHQIYVLRNKDYIKNYHKKYYEKTKEVNDKNVE